MDLDEINAAWKALAPRLAELGVDTDKVALDKQVWIIRQVDSEPVEVFDWHGFVEELLEKHPKWETVDHARRRHAAELIEEADFGIEEVDELIEKRYAGVVKCEKDMGVYCAGDTNAEIATFVATTTADDERGEWVEEIIDLNTGKVYATYHQWRRAVVVTFRGQTATKNM